MPVEHIESSVGNATIIVLIHDDSESALIVLEAAVLTALRHFGIPFQIISLNNGCSEKTITRMLASHSALLIPQSGTFLQFSESFKNSLRESVMQGLGLICYEPDLSGFPTWLLHLYTKDGFLGGVSSFTDLVTLNNDHYITWTREPRESVHSDQALICATGMHSQGPALVVSETGDELLLFATHGQGRLVLFPFSSRFFSMEYLGHACGADDLFTRSIIWAARKPFVTWSMPPMAGLLVDDCSGSYNHFGYLTVMNAHGWSPYLSLFTETIDEVAHEDIHKAERILRSGWEQERLEIGFHALRYNDSFCYNHLQRRPLTIAELDTRFAAWDRYEREWGVKHSCWAHPHFGEIGANAVAYYRERGIKFLTYLLPFDAAWFDVPSSIDPIPAQPPYGHAGYYMSPHPKYADLMLCNCVLDHKNRSTSDYVARTDYLWNHTPFWDESKEPLIVPAVEVLVEQIRRGIDSGFYGEGATHEQRIACLREGELQELFQEADLRLARYALEKRLLGDIMKFMKQRMESSLVTIERVSGGNAIRYGFSTDAAIGTELQFYENTGDGVLLKRFVVKTREGDIGVS